MPGNNDPGAAVVAAAPDGEVRPFIQMPACFAAVGLGVALQAASSGNAARPAIRATGFRARSRSSPSA